VTAVLQTQSDKLKEQVRRLRDAVELAAFYSLSWKDREGFAALLKETELP
jgi:hypothetical protein